ncbi:histidine kinase [Herbaspirillum chlorophenolicum]|uniref:HAMP domain-containing sensor histidine kinase n=1 Tax=Herbaspirillum chlorophenolicum TaxID=211589 RepID=UPI0012E21B9D|nr:histidine kinase [Herbaspirillum chlorophenolicum]
MFKRLQTWWHGRKRLGMFWRFLFAMMLATLIGMELLAIGLTLFKEYRIVRDLESPLFSQGLDSELLKIVPTLESAQNNQELFALVLGAFINKGKSLDVLADNGTSSRAVMVTSGRLSVAFISNGQTICSYPNVAASQADTGAWSTATPQEFHFRTSFSTDKNVQGELNMKLALFRSPALIWMATKDISWNFIFVFLAFLNICSAIALAPILVRRIKRAEKVARSWTEGNLHARINDSRKDEFGDLIRSFNTLADSFLEVIRVKQELAAVEERNRLARDLHDTAKQRAFALNLQLTALSTLGDRHPGEASRITSSASTLAQHLQNDLSNVIRRLSASTVAELGMREVLRQEIGSLFDGSRIRWKISISDEIDSMMRDAPHLAQQILLIVMEASANALRHSGAELLAVEFSESNDRYTLVIEDDGKGFDAIDTSVLGMGLANMRLRAKSLPQGEFSIVNRSEGGVAITVRFQF